MKIPSKKISLFVFTALSIFVIISILLFTQSKENKLTACPYGHTYLKNIPIEYGYIIQDSNYYKAIENYEFYPGGCEIFYNAPKHKLICTKCGYVLENDSTNFWIRTKKENQGFAIPLNNIISNFPIKSLIRWLDQTSLSYTQEYEDGKITREAINYDSRNELEDLDKFLNDYAKSCSLNLSVVDLSRDMHYENCKHLKAYKSIVGNRTFELIIYSSNDYDPIKVSFSWSLSNKYSAI